MSINSKKLSAAMLAVTLALSPDRMLRHEQTRP